MPSVSVTEVCMIELIRGHRTPLSQLVSANTIDVRVSVEGDAREYDVACFLLGEDGRVISDAHVVFYNQTSSPDGAVRLTGANPASFTVDLTRVDFRVQRLSFAVNADGGEMRGVRRGAVSIVQAGEPRATLSFQGLDFPTERAIITVELYKRNGEWRLYTHAQGFAGGLAALIEYFGGGVEEPRLGSPAARPVVSPVGDAAPGGPPVALTKRTLRHQGDTASIPLAKAGAQRVHVNLNWNDETGRHGGMFGRGAPGVDLDLGCMIEMDNGDKGVMQAVGGFLGRSGDYPYIYIDKDDRSGASSDGENLYIERPELIRRVLVFAFIYHGTCSFRDVNARMTLRDTAGNEVLLHLDNPSSMALFCAVALLERVGDQLVIRKEERYFRDHEACDHEHYRFDFSWTSGRK